MRYIAEDNDQDIKPGTVQPGQDITHWDNVLGGSKISIHYEYYPAILKGFFYVTAGPAFQTETYRADNIETWPAVVGKNRTKYSSFGYDASTIGIDSGIGVRIFPESRRFYVGAGIFEHYRPLKRLSYRGVGSRPTVLANQRLESPDSPRYKILSMKVGVVF